jgi:hypothetical protein
MSSEGLTTAEKRRLLGALRAVEGTGGPPVVVAARFAGVSETLAQEWIGCWWDETANADDERRLLDSFEADL